MSIRNTAKAIIVHNNKILLDRCHTPDIGNFFTLPGGGQHQYETLEEALVRECLEETGYTVTVKAFVSLYEEIYTSESIRESHPDYAHKILHIFKCGLANEIKIDPSEQDDGQLECVWLDINEIESIKLLPACVADHIHALIHSKTPLYLGSHFINFEETV